MEWSDSRSDIASNHLPRRESLGGYRLSSPCTGCTLQPLPPPQIERTLANGRFIIRGGVAAKSRGEITAAAFDREEEGGRESGEADLIVRSGPRLCSPSPLSLSLPFFSLLSSAKFSLVYAYPSDFNRAQSASQPASQSASQSSVVCMAESESEDASERRKLAAEAAEKEKSQ